MSYFIAEWTERYGKGVAQTDKGQSALKRYSGVVIGSGKIMLSMRHISQREFEANKKRGIKTI